MRTDRVAAVPVSAVITGSLLYLHSPLQAALPAGVLTAVVAAVFLYPHRRVPRSIDGMVLAVATVAGTSVVSAAKLDTLTPVVVYGGFAAGTAAILYVTCGVHRPEQTWRTLTAVLATVGIVVVGVGIATAGVGFYRYQGMFDNPNSLGWFAASLAAFFASVLAAGLVPARWRWATAALAAVLVVLVVASNSRTATGGLAVAAVVIAAVWLPRLRPLWTGLHTSRRIAVIATMLTGVVTAAIAVDAGVHHAYLEKFARHDPTMRLTAWQPVIDDWTWFGLGRDYAQDLFITGPISGHSVWFHQVATFGLVPAVGYAATIGYVLVRLLRRARYSPSALVGATMLASFAFMASFDTVGAAPAVWVGFASFGLMHAESSTTPRGYECPIGRHRL